MKKIVARLLTLLLLGVAWYIWTARHPYPNPTADEESLGIFHSFSSPKNDLAITLNLPVHQLPFKDIYDGQQVKFYYHCHPQCPQIVIELPTDSDIPVEITVTHPIFSRYPMHFITDNSFSLFQQTYDFASIASFTSKPPPHTTIFVDDLILRYHPSPQFISLNNYLPDQIPDYILTTYQKPRIFGDWYEFTRFHGLNDQTNQTATISGYLLLQETQVTLLPIHPDKLH
jgi:hypothetical protein